MHYNTYVRKTKHVKDVKEKTGPRWVVEAAKEFLVLRTKYLKALTTELAATEQEVVRAKSRIKELQQLIAKIENHS